LQPLLCKLGVLALLLMMAANVLLTFAECGPGVCPDNPTDYWLLR
ncbi:MAG: disulfide bond formation protein B, partial [Xanthomonadales bacterium]|nr:disulfide bond formation protein B [Xanthomonadales bacterium]